MGLEGESEGNLDLSPGEAVSGGGLMNSLLGLGFPRGPSSRTWELGEAHGSGGGGQQSEVSLETSP